ncbi:hypothetical protein GCM10023193_63380 [Planotetraspora kaengkrachanensis]|uniref:DUF3592 domain-containing protein n=1 Tax=Planotetraspora kaengkrachanensis TaxID=575193 RepID=A0A8J3PXQ9_9ACTN|nr:hypothetical protein Pka01_62130 [Planotetraspora kaengkrachanensis]
MALATGYAWGLWPGAVGMVVLVVVGLVAIGVWMFVTEFSDFRLIAYASCVTMAVAYIAAFGGLSVWILAARGVETSCSVTSREPWGAIEDSSSEMRLSCADDSRQVYRGGTLEIGERIDIVYDPDHTIMSLRAGEVSAAPIYTWVVAVALGGTVLLRLVEAVGGEDRGLPW